MHMNDPHPPSTGEEASNAADAAFDARLRSALGGAPPGFDVRRHYRRVQGGMQATEPLRRRERPARWRAVLARAWGPAAAFALGAACTLVLMPRMGFAPAAPVTIVEPLGEAADAAGKAERVLQVRFHDAADLSAVRAALRAVDAEVIGGPGALGVWRLRVPAAQARHSLRVLAAHPAVLEVRAEP